jgi:hypothetical protein
MKVRLAPWSALLLLAAVAEPAVLADHPAPGFHGRLPQPAFAMSAVWTGPEAYLFGGADMICYCELDWILRYDPATGSFEEMATRLPWTKAWSTAVWDGAAAHVFLGTHVARFDPADGTVTTRPLGAYQPGGGFAVAYSNDYGATFKAVRAGEGSGGSEGIDPGVAVDTAGNDYGAYWGPEGIHAVVSQDEGATWSEPRIVSPPELKSFEMVDAIAGDEGRVAIAYIATAESNRGPNRADGWAKWHLYLSMSENALAENATWVTARVTPEDDPVQIGSVCTSGVGCFGGNRNLLDFIDVQVGPDGRSYVAYTDGCIPDHETTPCKELPQESRENYGYIAVQDEGPRLFADRAPWA